MKTEKKITKLFDLHILFLARLAGIEIGRLKKKGDNLQLNRKGGERSRSTNDDEYDEDDDEDDEMTMMKEC